MAKKDVPVAILLLVFLGAAFVSVWLAMWHLPAVMVGKLVPT